jgi:hypothetical protein
MKIVTAAALAAAALLFGAIPTWAGGLDVQTEGRIFLNEVAQIPQMQDAHKFRQVVGMRFDMFTLAYATSTPVFSETRKFDVRTRLTFEDYKKAAQVIESMMRGLPASPNPALGVLRHIVDDCASAPDRCSY